MSILNLTQHQATFEQIDSGVYDLDADGRKILSALLTFDELPSGPVLIDRAQEIAALAADANDVMIGGAPFFMSVLEKTLLQNGKRVHYAFSKRVSVEALQPDGSIKKLAMFKHAGFVSVWP